VIEMANKKVNKKPNQVATKKSKDVFTDPTESIWGKIVVGLIIFGTIATILIGAIITVVQAFS